jgi:rod shape-determining protein MreD
VDHPLARYGIVVVSVVLVQYAFLGQFRMFGVAADLLLVLAIVAGMRSGIELGAVVGFVCGLAVDLLTATPFGLGAISYLTAGAVAAGLERLTVHSARWLSMTVAGLSALVSLLLFALLGTVLGQNDLLGGHLLTIVVIVGFSSAVLALPMLRVARWADRDDPRIRHAAR